MNPEKKRHQQHNLYSNKVHTKPVKRIPTPLTHYQSGSPSTYRHQKSARAQCESNLNYQAMQNDLQMPRDSLHNTPPLLFLLLLRSETHHLAIVAHGSARFVHVALESLVEPATYETGGVAGHLGVAGAALAVVFAATLLGSEVAKKALRGGRGLECKGQWMMLRLLRWKLQNSNDDEMLYT